MAIEGWMSIQAGDNPGIVHMKLGTYFIEESEHESYLRRERSVGELRDRLRDTPTSRMTLVQMAELYRDMSYVARQQGILVLASLADEIDDPVLAVGIREAVHEDEVRRGPAQVPRVFHALTWIIHESAVWARFHELV